MRFYGLTRPRLLVPCLLAAALAWPRTASAQTQIKPRFVIMIDTSGSMTESTGAGNNSCGQTKTKINDAKCVLSKLNDSFGDIEFALGRFKGETCTGTCNWGGDNCASTPTNTLTVENPNRGEMLVAFGPENANDIGEWVDFSCNTCTISTTGALNPELGTGSGTPLAGYIRASRRYLQGGDPIFPGNPISADAFSTCRPYRVIMLTDGAATCGETQAVTVRAIRELHKLGTAGIPEAVMPIDVRTDVIGFGIAAGDGAIEAYAHAGGRADVGGQNEGFYATDEPSLALALSQIVQGSLLVEVCDGVDNDCDGQVDEGFNINQPCDGGDSDLCREGITVCINPTTVGCNDPAGENDVEVCNGIDDDCDGLIDEPPANCPACVFNPEICDGIDNNCNNMIDEGLNRPCGTDVGACTAGTETCVNGNWVGCNATNGTAESCNNVDDDCDGVIDGMTRDCGQPMVGQCQPGQQVCQNGSFGACVGAIGPTQEGCDNIDNDCDGMIDEGVPGLGQPCGTLCGQGTTQCVNGMVVCVGASMGGTEICNNVDDDCDGLIDEGQPSHGPCSTSPGGEPLCTPGTLECVGGTYQCVGGTPTQPEICDCLDNDCDSQTDEGNLCGSGGATCLSAPDCQCALPCDPGEFPCPEGFTCTDSTSPHPGFCVHDRCFGVSCQPTSAGEATVCVDGACVPACSQVNCAPAVCRPADGMCVEDNCNGFPERCTATQFCVNGTCVDDPCAGVSCTSPEYCLGGHCVLSCADVTCGMNQMCVMGVCQDSLCAGVFCPMFQVCNPQSGMCQQSHCLGTTCPPGQACDPLTGNCAEDACLGVHCPSTTQICHNGTCYDPDQILPPDTTQHTYVSAAGSGCTCQAGARGRGGRAPVAALLLLVGVAALLVRRRRRAEVR